MRSLVTRRAALFAGASAMAAVALAGCSAGQVAETALKRPSNQGLNVDNSNQTVLIRNLAVVYNGTVGYPAGASAPIEVSLFNQTDHEVQVTVTSTKPDSGTGVYGSSVGVVGPASAPAPDPSASSEPASNPEPQPARITIAPMSAASFMASDEKSLQVIGLSGKLTPGNGVNLTFSFSNGADPLTVVAPMGIPLTPASRAPGIEGENSEG
jgi:hypothetical protein